MHSFIVDLFTARDYLLLALGLGFVVFFHELGHFLAAKYCDVKVEQFAVGFGPAIFAWRKGIGFRRGTTTAEYEKIIDEHVHGLHKSQLQINDKSGSPLDYATAVGQTLGLGETEYRLNWIPLGGYVKMLGQDDMKPGVVADGPRAYNNKTVRSRMLIVSAGVIMNVILAAAGFMTLFMIGYPVPPATVGGVISNSPASRAARADGTIVGLQPGDKILSFNGNSTYGDFSKILLNVALTRDGTRVPIVVQHPDGMQETLYVTPEKPAGDPKALMMLGVSQPFVLAGPEPSREDDSQDYAMLAKTDLPDVSGLQPGDIVTQLAGQDVTVNLNAETRASDLDISRLYAALEASNGKPIELTVRSSDGTVTRKTVTPHFAQNFTKDDLDFLGLVPRGTVVEVDEKSPALDRLRPGDVVLAVDVGSDHLENPTPEQVRSTLSDAADKGMAVSMTVLNPDSPNPRVVSDLNPTFRLAGGKHGLGIGLGCDEQHLVVAQTLQNSSASDKIPSGATLTSIDGNAVSNWFDVRRIVQNAHAGEIVLIGFIPPEKGAKPAVAAVKVSQQDIDSARQVGLTQYLTLRAMISPLHTHNPLVAMKWGVVATRDLILQFYITLQRMLTRDVDLSNVMGPVGMVHAGAMVASRGTPWLLWFLCNISANLAVVNFLPIPIVDGGLFTLLILEKIQGKPLSPDAQRIVQMVGLVLIVGVFLLITYQDIARMAGY